MHHVIVQVMTQHVHNMSQHAKSCHRTPSDATQNMSQPLISLLHPTLALNTRISTPNTCSQYPISTPNTCSQHTISILNTCSQHMISLLHPQYLLSTLDLHPHRLLSTLDLPPPSPTLDLHPPSPTLALNSRSPFQRLLSTVDLPPPSQWCQRCTVALMFLRKQVSTTILQSLNTSPYIWQVWDELCQIVHRSKQSLYRFGVLWFRHFLDCIYFLRVHTESFPCE